MCKSHMDNILTFFVHSFTNGRIEGLNKKAYGYRNMERFKTDLFFHLGSLDLSIRANAKSQRNACTGKKKWPEASSPDQGKTQAHA